MMLQTLKEYWFLFMGGITLVMWLVRLESRSLANEKLIERFAEQRIEDLANTERNRNIQNEELKEMRQDTREIRADIKLILAQLVQK